MSVTEYVSVFAAIIAILMGIGLGTFAGSRRNKLPDHLTRIFSISGSSMPTFWFAIVLLIVFWVILGCYLVGRVVEIELHQEVVLT